LILFAKLVLIILVATLIANIIYFIYLLFNKGCISCINVFKTLFVLLSIWAKDSTDALNFVVMLRCWKVSRNLKYVRFESVVATAPRLLVWGGNGSLGQSVIKLFKEKEWDTVSVDYTQNTEAATNIVLGKNKSWKENALDTSSQLGKVQFSMMVNTAGAWVGGSIEQDTIFEQFDRMIQFNSKSAVALSHLATKHLSDGGSLILTGAAGALGAAPSMLAYQLSKQLVHSLVITLGDPKRGLAVNGARVAAILPVVIDTPSNRQAMPEADTSQWTPPLKFAERILAWAEGKSKLQSGGLYKFTTSKGGKTSIRLVS